MILLEQNLTPVEDQESYERDQIINIDLILHIIRNLLYIQNLKDIKSTKNINYNQVQVLYT